MADLVDRENIYVWPYSAVSSISPEGDLLLPIPPALDESDDEPPELLEDVMSLLAHIRALKLHLAMVHSCSYPDGESFDDGAE